MLLGGMKRGKERCVWIYMQRVKIQVAKSRCIGSIFTLSVRHALPCVHIYGEFPVI